MTRVFNRLPDGLEEVDVIIAGGGTAACVIAARLSDADPTLSVLIVEGGKSNLNEPSVVYPVLCLSHLLPTSTNTLFYQGIKEPNVGGRQVLVQSGGTLGGGSSINLMTYSRAQRTDLDAWNMPGWSADELVPFMRKLETYHGPGKAELHGHNGPIQVSSATYKVPRTEEGFIDAAAQLGWSEAIDMQDLETSNVVQRNLRYISPDGKRSDAAHAYLHPRLKDSQRSGLQVLVENQVVRVVFEGRKAQGIEFEPNPRFQAPAAARTVKARKLVIVSCGALGSPLVLERSGVGDPKILTRAGVDVVAEVPGVGHDYLDHHLHVHPYKSSLEPEETIDAVFSGRRDFGELIKDNDGILGWNASDVTSKLRPSKEDIEAFGPEFQAAWARDYANDASRPAAIITPLNGFPGDPSGVPAGQYFATSTFTTYPYSRGHMHITGPKVDDPADFRTGFLSDPANLDIKMCAWVYKTQRELVRRMDIYRGEVASGHPPFPATSGAACIETDGPLTEVKNLVYSDEDEVILEQWLRNNVSSTWHSMGTCRMAPRGELGVVDSSLNVYGVDRLKVADLSIPPSNVGANTANTAYLIGEKAADIFIKELGL